MFLKKWRSQYSSLVFLIFSEKHAEFVLHNFIFGLCSDNYCCAYVCMVCVYLCTCPRIHLEAREQLCEVNLFFHLHMFSWDLIHIIRLRDKCFYSLNHFYGIHIPINLILYMRFDQSKNI